MSSSSRSPVPVSHDENPSSSPSLTTDSSTPVPSTSPKSRPTSSAVLETVSPSPTASEVGMTSLPTPLSKKKFGSTPEVDDAPHQPTNFEFPERQFGNNGMRKFRAEWFKKFAWLHYDESSDRAFCHTCICAYKQGHMTTTSDNIEPTFISTGYNNWRDAFTKARGFAKHEQSSAHQHAVMCVVKIPATTVDVGELLNDTHAEGKSVARQSLLKILSNIRFLARQALPLRGDGTGEPNSNFNQLFFS